MKYHEILKKVIARLQRPRLRQRQIYATFFKLALKANTRLLNAITKVKTFNG